MDTNYKDNIIYQHGILKVDSKLFSSKVDFTMDLGLLNNDPTNEIIQKTLQVTQYHSVVDALNYLSTLGWQTIHVQYHEFSGTTYNNPQYLLRRKISG